MLANKQRSPKLSKTRSSCVGDFCWLGLRGGPGQFRGQNFLPADAFIQETTKKKLTNAEVIRRRADTVRPSSDHLSGTV